VTLPTVHVVYADLSVQSVDVAHLDDLTTTGVQAVLMRSTDGRNLGARIGYDWYAPCYMERHSTKWGNVLGVDDNDWSWRPNEPVRSTYRDRIPLGCTHVWLEGSQVSDAQYARIEAKYRKMVAEAF